MVEKNKARSSKEKSQSKKTTSKKSVAKKGKSSRKVTKGSCFVLMPFREPYNTYYDVIIKPAVSAANLKVTRGDSLFNPAPIMNEIWRMIQEAKVLIAELTGKNPNVFYELGLAHAIGKPVILISETMDDVPFDLQPLRIILYDKNDPSWGDILKENITKSIDETLAELTRAVPPMFRKKVKSQAPEDSELSVRLDYLERRIASIPLGNGIKRDHSVNWETVYEYVNELMKEDIDLDNIDFTEREHAIAWVIVKNKLGTSDIEIENYIRKQLVPKEANIVLELGRQQSRFD